MKSTFFSLIYTSFLIISASFAWPIVSRSGWRSRIRVPATAVLHLPINRVFIHHTLTSPCSNPISCSERLRLLQKITVEAGYSTDVRFNFLIGGDGRVYEGTGWNSKSDHIKGYEDDLSIALIGNFEREEPPTVQLELLEILIVSGVLQGKISRSFSMYVHSDASCESCPGDKLADVIKSWPRYAFGGILDRPC